MVISFKSTLSEPSNREALGCGREREGKGGERREKRGGKGGERGRKRGGKEGGRERREGGREGGVKEGGREG